MRLALITLSLLACATSQVNPHAAAEWRARLAKSMPEEVSTIEQRDRLSRLLADAVDGGALQDLSMPEVESAFGRGAPCVGYRVCEQHGFGANDWYYEVGRSGAPRIKQVPVMIVHFSQHGYVERVFTLKTH